VEVVAPVVEVVAPVVEVVAPVVEVVAPVVEVEGVEAIPIPSLNRTHARQNEGRWQVQRHSARVRWLRV